MAINTNLGIWHSASLFLLYNMWGRSVTRFQNSCRNKFKVSLFLLSFARSRVETLTCRPISMSVKSGVSRIWQYGLNKFNSEVQLVKLTWSRLIRANMQLLRLEFTRTTANLVTEKRDRGTRLYTAVAVWYRHPSGQPTETVIPNLN